MKYRVEEHSETGNNVPSIDIVEDDGKVPDGVVILGTGLEMRDAKIMARNALKEFKASITANAKQIAAMRDPKARFPACDQCGCREESVKWTNNPYAEEINGEIKPGYWCDECYHQACMDI